MATGKFDDEIWDEYQWESHINEIEKKSNQLRKFISPHSGDNTPRWLRLLQESRSELDAVDAFIEEELAFEEAYFPEDEDEWDDEDEDEFDDDFLFGEDEDDFLYSDSDYWDDDDDDDDWDEMDEGEEWKSLTEDYVMSDDGSIENLDIYNDARALAASVLEWAESIPPRFHTHNLSKFVDTALKIGAKIAAGYSFGFEQDMLGGNIVYNKKALVNANNAISLLQKQKTAKYMTQREYYYLHERIFELRNEVGIYVQELRERFRLGFE